MLLENYVDKGILLERICHASKFSPIKFFDGQIEVGGETIGHSGCAISFDVIERAIELAYEENILNRQIKESVT